MPRDWQVNSPAWAELSILASFAWILENTAKFQSLDSLFWTGARSCSWGDAAYCWWKEIWRSVGWQVHWMPWNTWFRGQCSVCLFITMNRATVGTTTHWMLMLSLGRMVKVPKPLCQHLPLPIPILGHPPFRRNHLINTLHPPPRNEAAWRLSKLRQMHVNRGWLSLHQSNKITRWHC